MHTLRRSLAARLNYTWYSNICILSNNAKLSTGRPLLPAYNFSATVASTYCTYRLWSVENMPPQSPLFGRWLLWPNGWMDQDTTSYGGMLRPKPAPPRKGAQQPPTFRPNALARTPAGPHFTHNPHCRLGSARRAALVAVLPDKCHPSSFALVRADWPSRKWHRCMQPLCEAGRHVQRRMTCLFGSDVLAGS